MEIVVLVLCLLGFLLAGFVIFIFARLSAVGADVHSLRRELAGLTQRVDRLAAQAAIPVAPVTAAAAAAPSLGQFVLPGARTDRPPAAASAPADPERDPVPVARAVPAESPQAPPRPPFQLEQLLGANWLARLGIAAIAVAAAFFLQYAFKSGWIGPAAQVGMGVVASVLMVGAGQALIRRERYRSYAEVLTSGGVIILFLSVYAAYNFYRLLPSGPALGVLAVAALAVSALAVRTGSLSVAGICLLGAFAAPALIRAPGGNPLNLYAYLAFLNLWALGLLRFKPWQELVVLSFVCTWSLFFLSSPASRGQVAPVQLFATAFLALGVWSGLQAAADTRRDGSLVPAGFLLVGLAAAAYTAASLAVLWGTTFLGVPAILPAALVACLALVAVAVLSPVSTPESAAPRRGLVWLACAGIAILTLAAVVQARAIPAAQAPPAFAFIVTQYLLFLGAALALRRSEAAGGLAPALVGVNAATHLVATLMVLGNVYLMGIGGYALWPVPAGLLGLAAWWAAARRDPDTRLGTAFVGSALGLGVLGMLAAQSGRALPPHAAWVFGGMFVGSSLAWLALRRDLERLGAYAGVVPVLGNALALFPLILGALGERQLSGVALGAAAALLMAAYHAGVARLLLRPAQEETRFQALLRLAHYGLAATFVAVAMPLQLRGDYERAHLALAWSVEAAALVWAGLAARDARVRSWGYVLLAVAAGKAALVDLPLLSPGPGFWPFLNERGLAGGSIVAAAGVSAFLLARRSKELTEPEKALPQVLTVLANVFALLFGSVDLYHWAGDRWPRSPLGSAPQLSLSLYWTVYALGAAGAGIWRRNRPVRLLAVGLLYVSAIKVFLFDLAGLETPYRIVSFLVLGIVLLLVSLLYTRFEERFSSPPEES